MKYFYTGFNIRKDRGWRKDDVMTSGLMAASNRGLFNKLEARAREDQ